MKKLHLTTTSKMNLAGNYSVFIYAETNFINEVDTSSQTNLLLDHTVEELTFVYGNVQRTISLAQINEKKKQSIQLTEDLSIELRLVPRIYLLDQTNLILSLLSGLLAVAYSIFTTSNWKELLFLSGSTIIVLLLFMILYKHPIHTGHYNLRMFMTISALLLIFFLIPIENWTIKTLIGLSTFTVITRFIKDYQRTLALVYNPFNKS
ncbi:hypothetical protein [Myroides sp. WP-1]|uniref:hypothetical protein n=1 Tax=Myroides sp. WP-1 TaxID=2759944 RepID=UPI0015F8A18F|nr:hypothetical protein [Myroides sp. WP-1]MBB1139605.1 hypothetical protein [Myroides sp. WP-1]